MTYSIIQAITNNYDPPSECLDCDATHKILFTDKPLNFSNWEQRIITPNKKFPFDDIFKIRWNPFEYTDTDYVIWLDGSLRVIGSLKKYIDEFASSGADFSTLIHPKRTNIFTEYYEWCKIRNYPKEKAFKWMYHMMENGWNPKDPGLYQVNICIFKNSTETKKFCEGVLSELHTFNGEHLERLDQTVVTYLLKTKFRMLKIFGLNKSIYKNGNSLSEYCNHPRR